MECRSMHCNVRCRSYCRSAKALPASKLDLLLRRAIKLESEQVPEVNGSKPLPNLLENITVTSITWKEYKILRIGVCFAHVFCWALQTFVGFLCSLLSKIDRLTIKTCPWKMMEDEWSACVWLSMHPWICHFTLINGMLNYPSRSRQHG